MVPGTTTIDPLSAVFAALADPTRRAILARLAAGDTNPTELAAPFAMTMPAVTKHLKVLERAGLISRSRQAQARPCHMEPEPLRSATDWMAQYRHMWDARLDRLDAFLASVQPPANSINPLPAMLAATATTPQPTAFPIKPQGEPT